MYSKEERGYVSLRAKCPLYIRQAKRRIYCEGTRIGCRISLLFANQEERNLYLKANCESSYERCRMYGMILSEYPEDEQK